MVVTTSTWKIRQRGRDEACRTKAVLRQQIRRFDGRKRCEKLVDNSLTHAGVVRAATSNGLTHPRYRREMTGVDNVRCIRAYSKPGVRYLKIMA